MIREIEMPRIQTSNNVKVGEIIYLTEKVGDAPISVYVLRGEKGDMLIDTGFATTYKSVLKWIEENHFNITDIFITHAHPDHDWNVAKLKNKYNAKVWINKKDISLIRNFQSQNQMPTAKRYRFRVEWITFWTKMPFFKSKDYNPEIVIESEGSEVLKSYGYDGTIVFLPGHTLGSMGIKTDKVLYCGDAYAVINGQPMLPPHGTDFDMMNASVSKIKRINPSYLACGHGVPYRYA